MRPVLGYDTLWAESLKIGQCFSQYEKGRRREVAMEGQDDSRVLWSIPGKMSYGA
jgi:hypothetical protein